jgi:hypothetical protein
MITKRLRDGLAPGYIRVFDLTVVAGVLPERGVSKARWPGNTPALCGDSELDVDVRGPKSLATHCE